MYPMTTNNSARWNTDETFFLLNLWCADNIQSQIDGTVRDAEVYKLLSQQMHKAGFQRTPIQVKTRIKILKKLYRKQKDNEKMGTASNPGKVNSRFFKLLDRVLGDGTESPLPIDLEDEESMSIKIESVESMDDDPEVGMDATSLAHQSISTLPFTESSSVVTSRPSTAVVTSHPSSTVVTLLHPSAIVSSCASSPIVYDLCIVGAGMFGSAAARHASANVGLKICLVGPEEPIPQEMPNREIFGAHYDEGKLVNAVGEDVPSQILCKNSMKSFRELEKLSGIDFYHPVGYLRISSKSNSTKIIPVMDAINHLVVDLSFNDIFERRFPYIKLRSDDYPLLEDFGAGYINSRNMVAAQKAVAKIQGCEIIEDVVHEVKPLINGIHEIITENQGIIKAKRVLICAGAFTNFKNFPMPKLQFKINKETAALVKVSFKEAKRLSAMPTMNYARPEDKFGVYILPPILYPDGYHYIKVGHLDFEINDSQVTSLEEVKNWYLSKGDPEKINRMSKILIDILPGIKVEEITEVTCVTSHNISGHPYVDRVSPTVSVAAVGNGKGAQYSDEIGRIAATLSLTGKWESELPKSNFQVAYQN